MIISPGVPGRHIRLKLNVLRDINRVKRGMWNAEEFKVLC